MHVTILRRGEPREVIAPTFRVLIGAVTSICEKLWTEQQKWSNYFLNERITAIVNKFYTEIPAIIYWLSKECVKLFFLLKLIIKNN